MNAVVLSYSRANIKELAYEQDVRSELICRWGSKFVSYQGTGFLGNGNEKLTQEGFEIDCLKKELVEMRMESDNFNYV